MQYIVLAKTGNEKIVLSTYLLSNSTFCILTKTFCHIFCVFFSKRYPQRVHMNQNCIQSLDDIRINQLTKQPLFFISVTFRGFLSVVSKWVMVLELVYLVRKIVPKIFPSVITDFVYLVLTRLRNTPLSWMIFICLTMVDLPHSPAPKSNNLISFCLCFRAFENK